MFARWRLGPTAGRSTARWIDGAEPSPALDGLRLDARFEHRLVLIVDLGAFGKRMHAIRAHVGLALSVWASKP